MTTFDITDNAEIYGINPDLEVSYGYDGEMREMHPTNKLPKWGDPDMVFATRAEKVALAGRMIALWTKYRDAAT